MVFEALRRLRLLPAMSEAFAASGTLRSYVCHAAGHDLLINKKSKTRFCPIKEETAVVGKGRLGTDLPDQRYSGR